MPIDLTDLLAQGRIECRCGREHLLPPLRIAMGAGARREVGRIAAGLGLAGTALIAADRNTHPVAGRETEALLGEAGFTVRTHIFSEEAVKPDEPTLVELCNAVDGETGFLVAAGAGTINDLVKYVAGKVGRPYICVATAPSVDGYLSTGCALLLRGIKETVFPLRLPAALIADTEILAQAPPRLVASGFSDLLGKVTACADWLLGALVNGEYLCPLAWDLARQGVEFCLHNAAPVGRREPAAMDGLIRGLFDTGLAMSIAGVSRPASGAEHMTAHLLEIMDLLRGKEPALHGERVGVAAILICGLYEELFALGDDLPAQVADLERKGGGEEAASASRLGALNQVYGRFAPGIVAKAKRRLADRAGRSAARQRLVKAWPAVRAEVAEILLPAGEIRRLLAEAGAAHDLGALGITRAEMYRAVVCGKELRERYTILEVLDVLGLLDRSVRRAIARALPE